jgi:hypothetical protein
MFEKLLRWSMVGISSHISQLQEYIDDTGLHQYSGSISTSSFAGYET